MTTAMKLKDTPWKESSEKPRQCIKKQRHRFANKGPYSHSYDFPSSHVWIWELDHKESQALKNWCFRIVVLWGNRSERDMCTPMFITALFIIARTWKQPRCPSTDEWIRKMWYIYTMEYYSAIKKEFTWISSNEMDETGAHYTEWSKPER